MAQMVGAKVLLGVAGKDLSPGLTRNSKEEKQVSTYKERLAQRRPTRSLEKKAYSITKIRYVKNKTALQENYTLLLKTVCQARETFTADRAF